MSVNIGLYADFCHSRHMTNSVVSPHEMAIAAQSRSASRAYSLARRMAGQSADWRVAFMGNGCAAPRDFGGDGDAKLGFSCVRRVNAFLPRTAFQKLPSSTGASGRFKQ